MLKRYTTLISVEDFAAILSDKQTIVLDCRFYLNDVKKGRHEYLASHIPHAIYLDINHDLSGPVIKGVTGRHPLPHPGVLASTLKESGLNNESQVVVYDQANGAYASRCWWLLRWLGHESVAVLNGGFKAWLSAALPLDNQWTLHSPGNFRAQLHEEMTVPMIAIETMQESLVDSREYSRYTGEYEPIDPVAGHIPGAVCIPYMENTDESGQWKTIEALKKRFADLQPSPDEPPVFYCGSGVTACHNILAYKIATGLDARLYPGSWSEWINYHSPTLSGARDKK